MKYDVQLSSVKPLLPTAKSILIALPVSADIDKLASGLSLYLSLEQQGKEVTIVCEDTLRVGQAHLFSIDRIKQSLPSTGSSGNLILTLEGVEVLEENGKLTPKSLEKLDWYADKNNSLNLVFHVLSGQSFQPTKITPSYQGGGYDLIFTVGTPALANLGNIYNQNPQIFSKSHVVNIDNQPNNSNFGHTNVIDPAASSNSEIIANVMGDLGLFIDGDMATNILAGIFESTNNLTNEKAGADTFMVVANCLRAGGRKPQIGVSSAPQTSGFDLSAFMPQPQSNGQPQPSEPAQPTSSTIITNEQPSSSPALSFDQFMPQNQPQTAPPQVDNNSNNTPSAEERPAGEGISSESSEVEPDWLTPKIFKGTSIG